MPPIRTVLWLLPALALLLVAPLASGASQPQVARVVRADKPKQEITYRVDYRGLAAKPKWGHFYMPTHRVIKSKGGAPTVVQGPVKLRAGWGVVMAPTSWRQFRTVDSPQAAARVALSLQQMGLQTRVVRRTHRG